MLLSHEELLKVGKRGDIIVLTSIGFDPIGGSVRWWTGSEYSHTAIYLGDGEIVEAIYTGVHKVKWTETPYATTYKAVILRPAATTEQIEAALEYAQSKVGLKYDYLLFFATAPLILLTRLGFPLRGVRNYLDIHKAYICIELVVDSYFEASAIILIASHINRSQAIPDDLIRNSCNMEQVGAYNV